MVSSTPIAPLVRFGPFELDLRSADLKRDGRRERLQGQPAQLLTVLVSRRGELVTREELRLQLWPQDTFVDFDHGLNNAVNRIREVLGDSASSPRYIETVPRRGYRFIADVHGPEQPATVATHDSTATAGSLAKPVWFRRRLFWAAAATVALIGVLVALRLLFPPVPRIQSIAVLPFANLSGDASQEYFADGITDQLTGALANVRALRVISRTSAMQYKNSRKTMPEIARELGVEAVVEGSVVRSAGRVRITAQLIDARSDRHFWSSSYERDLRDVIALQNDVARSIAEQIKITLTPQDQQRMAAQTVNPQAHEAYLRGRFFEEKWTPASAAEALKLFQQAIAADPNYAVAYVGVADCYVFGPGVPGMSREEEIREARSAASKALELNPDLGEAHAALAQILEVSDLDMPGAEREFKKAIELSPNYATGHHEYSHLLLNLGRYAEALGEAQKMIELDPVSLAANLHLGDTYLESGDFDKAIEQEKKTLALDPNYGEAQRQLGEAYLGKRMYREAIQWLGNALSADSGNSVLYRAMLANAKAQSGDRADAAKWLRELRSDPSARPAILALLYAGLGDKNSAFEALEDARQRRRGNILSIGNLPEFQDLRSDPRFHKLLCELQVRSC